jgi:lactosylceramide 4-alpha-galactosyltransferase
VFTARYGLLLYVNRYAWSESNRSLDALGSNYAGLQPPDVVANGVVNCAWGGIGHEVADMCLKELKSNFRGNIWSYNGPGLITRVLQRMCNFSQVSHPVVAEARSLARTIQLHDVIT